MLLIVCLQELPSFLSDIYIQVHWYSQLSKGLKEKLKNWGKHNIFFMKMSWESPPFPFLTHLLSSKQATFLLDRFAHPAEQCSRQPEMTHCVPSMGPGSPALFRGPSEQALVFCTLYSPQN